MDFFRHFRRQLNYNAWANREVLAALQALQTPLDRPEKLLAHILSAELLWLARIKGQSPPLPVWPALTLAQCAERTRESVDLYREYFDRELPAAFDREIDYKNSKGELWNSRVEDILTHVFLHSAYHRGQIALLMREAGNAPAYTDFIHGVRQGFVK